MAKDKKPKRSTWTLPDRSLRKNQKPKKPGKPEMLVHYPNIVLYVHQSRYVTVDHILQRFKSRIKSIRTAQYQLARIVDLGLLKTVDVTSTGPNFPNVYIATGRGVSYLRKTFNLELVDAREEATSLPGVTHELFLTAFELACDQTVKQRPDLSIKLTERRYYLVDKRLRYVAEGKEQDLIPDAGFLLSVARPADQMPALLLYFAELDNGTELAKVVLAKFRKYVNWTATDDAREYLTDIYKRQGSLNPKPVYRLLVIARRQGEPGQDKLRMLDLFIQSLELPAAMRKRMWFATVDDLMAHEDDAAPLAAPVWLRVADAEPWLADYRAFVATLPIGQGFKPSLQKRDYVSQHEPAMPRHPMFPNPIVASRK